HVSRKVCHDRKVENGGQFNPVSSCGCCECGPVRRACWPERLQANRREAVRGPHGAEDQKAVFERTHCPIPADDIMQGRCWYELPPETVARSRREMRQHSDRSRQPWKP